MADDRSWEEQAGDEYDEPQPPRVQQQRVNPAANSFAFVPGQVFTPGQVSSFTPGQAYRPPQQQQQQFQQYQQYQQPYQSYQAQGYGGQQYGVPQYGAQGYGAQQYGGQQYQQSQSQGAPLQQTQIPIRTANTAAPVSNASSVASASVNPPKAKVMTLSLGGDAKPKAPAPAKAVKEPAATKSTEDSAKVAEKPKAVDINQVEKELEEAVDAETLREMYGKVRKSAMTPM